MVNPPLPPDQRGAYLRRAIELANEGRRAEATQMLRYLLRQDPSSVVAWRWLIFATSDQREARAAIEYLLRLNPGDEWAQEAMQRLHAQRMGGPLPDAQAMPRPRRASQGGIMPLWLSVGGLAMAALVIVLGLGLRSIANFDTQQRGNTFPILDNFATVPPRVQPAPEVNINSAVEYYTFQASSVKGIQDHLYNDGPQIDEDDHSIAVITYNFSVSRELYQAFSTCEVRNVVVNLDMLYTYPRWEYDGAVSASLVEQWDAFIAHVVEHEETHANIAIGCANDIVEAMATLPTEGSCQTMESTVNTLIESTYDTCAERQQAFDAIEGRTTFPLP